MDNEENKSLVKKDSAFVQKVGNQIAVTNKLLQNINSDELDTKNKGVRIGSQIWMAENLNVDRYRNGDVIPEVKDYKELRNLQTGAWCYYDNDPNNGKKYGRLYNWYAVMDERGLAPEGWHIPSDAEWTILSENLGGSKNAGTKMKSTTGWNSYDGETGHWDGNGNNLSGFNGLPCGYCFYLDGFTKFGNVSEWWSTSENLGYLTDNVVQNVWVRLLSYFFSNLSRTETNKVSCCSVRCVKD